MTNLLLSSLTASLQILFIHVLFWDGMILEGLKIRYNNTIAILSNKIDHAELLIKSNDKSLDGIDTANLPLVKGILCLIHNSLYLIRKPLFDCHICMTSIHGTIFWLIAFSDQPFLPFLFLVGGISVLISGIVNKAHEFSDLVYVKEKGI